MTFHRRRRRCAPVDLTGLHAVTHKAKTVVKKFETLTEKDTAMSTPNPQQSAIDTDVAALTASFTTLDGVFTDLQTQLAALPESVDTSGLDALVATGAAEVAKFQGIDTVNPPAPPAS